MKIFRPQFLRVFLGGLVLFSGSLMAEPQVTGYERFHSSQPSVEGGAILYSEFGCANCHGKSPVPIPRKGPELSDLKQRMDHDWLLSFLRDPGAARHGSNMPVMVHGRSDEEVEAIAAFLGTLGKEIRFNNGRHANAERGSVLYHEKGCVACHAPKGNNESLGGDEAIRGSNAFPDFKRKTSLEALNHFLVAPGNYRSDGRMPHLALDRQEAMDIAAYLIDFQPSDPGEAESVKQWPEGDKELVMKGRALVRELNCVACHAFPGEKKREVVALPDGEVAALGNCLSAKPVEGVPFYELSEDQRTSLLHYFAGAENHRFSEVSITLSALNCYACHERDGVGGPSASAERWFVGDESLGDSGRIPPPLTGIGSKLSRPWLEGVLRGDPGKRVRPYLQTRMPSYRGHAGILVDLFAEADMEKELPKRSLPTGDVEAGRVLLGTNGGVGCITCHSWEEKPSLGIPALNLSDLEERLRPEWFHRYLLNPSAYRPGTLMPSFWPGGQSSIPAVLDGEADKQIAAIWAFIEKGKGEPPGFPDTSKGRFELVPSDRPIIQRTFFKQVGTKAILVGFPGGVHLAYDGSQARPALLWKGKFFDAYHTWFTRFAPFEAPLGEGVSLFPKPDAVGRFRGYRLDEAGNPIFLVQSGGRDLEDHYEVVDGTMRRTVTWMEGEAPAVTHPEGAKLEEIVEGNTLTLVYSWD